MRITGLVLVGVAACGGAPAPSQPPPTHDAAVALISAEALLQRLSAATGRPRVVNFWATWCPPCRDEIPAFAAFHAAHPDVPLYGVSVDEGVSGKSLALKAKQLGITYPVLHDPRSDVANRYRVQAIPTTVVIDADGRIAAAHQGPLSQARLEALVSAP